MAQSSLEIPADAAPSLQLPPRSLVNGNQKVEFVAVRCLGETFARKSIQVNIPLDDASAVRTRAVAKMQEVRWKAIRPAVIIITVAWVLIGLAFLLPPLNKESYPWWPFIPLLVVLLALEVFDTIIRRRALPQHPRRRKNVIEIRDVLTPVAEEIVLRHPRIKIIP